MGLILATERRKLSGQNPKLVIDLVDMFGTRVPDSEAFKQAVGQEIIDKIRSRSGSGIDRKGNAFRKYSKSYAATSEFKAAGKSRGNPNMRLSGDMLEFMDIVITTRNTIEIGWDTREEQQKAAGHISGDKRGPGVKRDFFGLPQADYDEIANGFNVPTPDPSDEEPGLLSTLLTLGELFGKETT